MGVAVGGVPLPFFLRVLWVFVPGLQSGDPSWATGGSVGVGLGSFVLRSTGGRCCLFWPWSPWLPLPPPLFFLLAVLVVSASPWSVACLFPGGGLCGHVRGVFFFGPVGGCVAVVVRFFWLALVGLRGWSLSVLSVCPLGVARGVAWLGVLPASVEWVRGLPVVWLFLLLSSAPPGWRVCASGVQRAVRLFPVRRLVGFPRFPVVFFPGGGVACSSLCPFWAGACTGW